MISLRAVTVRLCFFITETGMRNIIEQLPDLQTAELDGHTLLQRTGEESSGAAAPMFGLDDLSGFDERYRYSSAELLRLRTAAACHDTSITAVLRQQHSDLFQV
jgi:hypothetical protein